VPEKKTTRGKFDGLLSFPLQERNSEEKQKKTKKLEGGEGEKEEKIRVSTAWGSIAHRNNELVDHLTTRQGGRR